MAETSAGESEAPSMPSMNSWPMRSCSVIASNVAVAQPGEGCGVDAVDARPEACRLGCIAVAAMLGVAGNPEPHAPARMPASSVANIGLGRDVVAGGTAIHAPE